MKKPLHIFKASQNNLFWQCTEILIFQAVICLVSIFVMWIHPYRLELFCKISEKFHNRWNCFKILTALYTLHLSLGNDIPLKVGLFTAGCIFWHNFAELMNLFIKPKTWLMLLRNILTFMVHTIEKHHSICLKIQEKMTQS